MSKTPEFPFISLGFELKAMRQKRQESLAEVSGAVEIEIDNLTNFELGSERPSEDILLLLISHFAVKEDEATKLWDLAGYDQNQMPSSHMANDDGNVSQTVMISPMDARIVYTDMVHVMVNNYGVVINFMQSSGAGNQPMAVSRVGMSREHAKSVLEVLQRTIATGDQKSLPSNTADTTEPHNRSNNSNSDK